MTIAAFEARGLEKHYRTGWWRRRPALRGIDLALAPGRTLGLVGPNGSGKSTLLRCLAGVERPSAGSLRVLGGDPLDGAVRRRTGWSPEDSPFPPELSPVACARLVGALAGRTGAGFRREVDERLDVVGLGAARRLPLGRFSRGMLRRFGLAQAFLGAPELVLLDEPTAGLDAEGFGALDRLLAEARRGGTTVVLSTHLLSDLEDFCDELAVLVDGRLAGRGAPDAVFRPEELEAVAQGLAPARRDELAAWLEAHGGALELRASARGLGALYRRAHGAGSESAEGSAEKRAEGSA